MAKDPTAQPQGPFLRVAVVWREEMMDERVFAEAQDVTLGAQAGVTFVTADLGLPPTFHMFRHTARGYLLTLGQGMGGELSLGGQRQKVADVVAGGGAVDRVEGAAGSFRAVQIQPGDWGVIHLDGVGEHVVFFQFVAPERSIAGRSRRGDELLLPAFIFAAAVGLLIFSLQWFDFFDDGRTLFQRSDALTAILVKRPAPMVELTKEEPRPQAGTDDGKEKAPPASAAGDEGKAGGQGDKPRERDPDPGDTAPVDPVRSKVRNSGVLVHSSKLRQVGSAMPSDRLGKALSRLPGENNGGGAGSGPGVGTGVGPGEGTGTLTRSGGKGPGGGGTAHADVVTQGKIDSGGTRPPKGVAGGAPKEAEVKFSGGTPEGDFDGLTRDQVEKAVMARRSAIRACYESELQRQPNLSGTVTLTWRILPDGTVKAARVKSSTMGSAKVESCIVRRINDIKFPASADGNDTTVSGLSFTFSGDRR
jgi:hypothetical protein